MKPEQETSIEDIVKHSFGRRYLACVVPLVFVLLLLSYLCWDDINSSNGLAMAFELSFAGVLGISIAKFFFERERRISLGEFKRLLGLCNKKVSSIEKNNGTLFFIYCNDLCGIINHIIMCLEDIKPRDVITYSTLTIKKNELDQFIKEYNDKKIGQELSNERHEEIRQRLKEFKTQLEPINKKYKIKLKDYY